MLNSIVWIAKGEVPKDGIDTKTPTLDEMLANHDEPVPANFDREAIAKHPDYWAGYSHLGTFYSRQARYAEAYAMLRRVTELAWRTPGAVASVTLLIFGKLPPSRRARIFHDPSRSATT